MTKYYIKFWCVRQVWSISLLSFHEGVQENTAERAVDEIQEGSDSTGRDSKDDEDNNDNLMSLKGLVSAMSTAMQVNIFSPSLFFTIDTI